MIVNIDAAAGGNQNLRNALLLIDGALSASTTTATAPASSFAVQGIDGKFLISITLPANIRAVSPLQRAIQSRVAGAPRGLVHQLRSATDNIFDAAGGVTVYGPSSQLQWEIQDPNQTKYWELRSSYDGVNWNDWQPLIDPTVCGIVPVWSGLASTGAISNVNAAYTPSGGSPLSNTGSSTRIDVASSVCTFGSAPNVTYSAGFVDPGSFGTWYVYCLDPKRVGGAVVYIATGTNPTVTSDDGIVYFGKITTQNGSGQQGDGGGGGPCCVAEVLSDLFDGTRLPQSALRRGMVLKGIAGDREPIERIDIIPNVPCFRFEGENGLALEGCSYKHGLQYDGGGFDDAGVILTTHRIETVEGPTTVKRTFIGMRTVYRLHLSGPTKTYICSGFKSHNARK